MRVLVFLALVSSTAFAACGGSSADDSQKSGDGAGGDAGSGGNAAGASGQAGAGSGGGAGTGGSAGADSGGAGAGGETWECPAAPPSGPCTDPSMTCDYSYPLECPTGCSGGDFHRYGCVDGQWEDIMHTVGPPMCACEPIDCRDLLGQPDIPLDPSVRRTVVGANGSFTDQCDVEGNLVQYHCQMEQRCGPDGSDCAPHPTGQVVPATTSCEAGCIQGVCGS